MKEMTVREDLVAYYKALISSGEFRTLDVDEDGVASYLTNHTPDFDMRVPTHSTSDKEKPEND